MERKLYDIVVDEDGETGMDFNSFVNNPAHGMSFIQFGKVQKFHFNNEKRIITGVAIAANVVIPRYNEATKEEYDVKFPPETIEVIRNKWFKNGFNNNINLEHSEKRLPKGVYMVESYIISSKNKNQVKPPEAFNKLNLEDGSWILSYRIDNDDVWERAKKGEFNGFSIEILSELKVINNKSSKMKKKKARFWEKKQVFASAKTVDSTIYFEGELGEGSVVYSDEEMTMVITDASLIIEQGEGEFKALELDGEGNVVSVVEAESFDVETAEDVETVEGDLVAEVVTVLDELPEEATMEDAATAVVDAVIDVIAEADEEQFATFKKFANHKILEALKLAREPKVEEVKVEEQKEEVKPSRKFGRAKSKPNGKVVKEEKKATFSDLRNSLKK